jgi:hypothetical protein
MDLPLRPRGKPPGSVSIYLWGSAVPLRPTALTDPTRAPGTVDPVACTMTPALFQAPGSEAGCEELSRVPPSTTPCSPDRDDHGGVVRRICGVELVRPKGCGVNTMAIRHGSARRCFSGGIVSGSSKELSRIMSFAAAGSVSSPRRHAAPRSSTCRRGPGAPGTFPRFDSPATPTVTHVRHGGRLCHFADLSQPSRFPSWLQSRADPSAGPRRSQPGCHHSAPIL